ncbi:hypothetical protein MKW94_012296 [Papaver nudicaule]|uniref:DnaJ homologue subfamily C member 28 conserved domain-containing protein n=1 Tax=Papaver nudicaule TaxID=74823 RepID=A0AA42B1V4_PAPNU|nr:hypothetical protein [Papaver nudicaule]
MLSKLYFTTANSSRYILWMIQLYVWGSETDIINVVEQRIWQFMEEGKFENLPGKDPAEYTLFRILKQNGCAPEWVELNKEIKNILSQYGLYGDISKLNKDSEALKLQIRAINDKVRHASKEIYSHGIHWEYKLELLLL